MMPKIWRIENREIEPDKSQSKKSSQERSRGGSVQSRKEQTWNTQESDSNVRHKVTRRRARVVPQTKPELVNSRADTELGIAKWYWR